MKREIAKKWIKALRSGKYQQGSDRLRGDGDQFCCLGVLCNLHAQAHPEIAATQLNPGVYLREAEVLPRAVMQWAGMTSKNGSIVDEDGRARKIFVDGMGYWDLTEINDAGESFSEIADVIEENWERL